MFEVRLGAALRHGRRARDPAEGGLVGAADQLPLLGILVGDGQDHGAEEIAAAPGVRLADGEVAQPVATEGLQAVVAHRGELSERVGDAFALIFLGDVGQQRLQLFVVVRQRGGLVAFHVPEVPVQPGGVNRPIADRFGGAQ